MKGYIRFFSGENARLAAPVVLRPLSYPFIVFCYGFFFKYVANRTL